MHAQLYYDLDGLCRQWTDSTISRCWAIWWWLVQAIYHQHDEQTLSQALSSLGEASRLCATQHLMPTSRAVFWSTHLEARQVLPFCNALQQ